MPIRRFRDNATGRTISIEWNSPRDPSEEEIATIDARQQAPLEHMKEKFPLPGPQRGFNIPPSLSDAPSRLKATGLPELDNMPTGGSLKSTVGPTPDSPRTITGSGSRWPGWGALGHAVNSDLSTTISQHLGVDDNIQREQQRILSPEEYSPHTGEYAGGLGIANSLTPGHVLAAGSIPAKGATAVAMNAPLAAGGVGRMVDPESSWTDRGLGGVDAVLSMLGMGARMPKFGRGAGKVDPPGQPYQMLRDNTGIDNGPTRMPPGMANLPGGPGTARTPGGHRFIPTQTTPAIQQIGEVNPTGTSPLVESPWELVDRLQRRGPNIRPEDIGPRPEVPGFAAEESVIESPIDTVTRRQATAPPQMDLPLQEPRPEIPGWIDEGRVEIEGPGDLAARLAAEAPAGGVSTPRIPYGATSPAPYRPAAIRAQKAEDADLAAEAANIEKSKKALEQVRAANAVAGDSEEAVAAAEAAAAERKAYGLGKSKVAARGLRRQAAQAHKHEPPVEGPPPPPEGIAPPEPTVPPTGPSGAPPAAAPPPATVQEAERVFSPEFGKLLADAGITPEMASRLSKEDLVQLVDSLKGQADEVGDAAEFADVPPLPAGKKVTPKGMAPAAADGVNPGLKGAKKVMVSIDQAAKSKGVNPKTIRRAIKAGKLSASRVGGQWRIDPDTLDKMGPWGGRSVDPVGAGGPPPSGRATPRVNDVIKGDERLAEVVSGLSKEERASVYREFAGKGKDVDPAELPQLLDSIVANLKARRGPGNIAAGIDPTRMGQAWKYPAVRAAIGGAVGANTSEDHPVLGGILGAAGGAVAGPGGGRQLNRLYYESMLAGPAQASNILGNIGTILSTPALEASRGNIGAAQQQLRNFFNPEAYSALGRGLKQGWNEARPVKYVDELPAGPMGRSLNAVDRATKNFMEMGGLSPEMAAQYTFTADPVTDGLKGLQAIQQRVPGMNKITPFIRTMGKQLELGAAHSPLRHLPTGYGPDKTLAYQLRDAFPVTPRTDGGSEWLNPSQYTAMLPAPLAAAAGLGIAGNNPTTSPTATAILGGLAAPYQVGSAYRNYQQHGRGTPSDLARATADQIPIAGDMLRIIENPGGYPGRLAQRFIPPALNMIGDRTVRDPRGEPGAFGIEDINGYLKERIPGLREDLPIRPNFFGEPEQRTPLGGLPEPLYQRDPRAAALAEMGLLRYQQSGDMGEAELTRPEQNELKGMRGKRMMEILGPMLDDPSQMVNFPDIISQLPPNVRAELEAEFGDGGGLQTSTDFYKYIQSAGTKIGTEEFKALRMMRRMQQQGGGQ